MWLKTFFVISVVSLSVYCTGKIVKNLEDGGIKIQKNIISMEKFSQACHHGVKKKC